MNNERVVILQLQLTRIKAFFLLTVFFVCWHTGDVGSETLTLTTYYPAPYGGYVSILTTGKTLLARDGGAVGVGTSNPTAKLEVAGQIKITGGAPGAGKVLTTDSTGLATWGYANMPKCNNILHPESSSNKPCNMNVYRCPWTGVVQGYTGGSWASYGCTGQLGIASTCLVVLQPFNLPPLSQVYACTFVGTTPLY